MNSDNVQISPYILLIQAAVRARHDLARLAEHHYGLTGAQLHTLCLLDPQAPAAMNTLSCQLACDASNVTGIVDRLAAQGYVTRQDDPQDRRIKVLVLTQKGAEVRAKIMQDITALEPDSMQRLTPGERQQFNTLLIKSLEPTQK